MIERRIVFEIHRLKDAGYSARQIARELRIGRETVKKYLAQPERTVLPRKPKASKLDHYRELIDAFLAQAPDVKTGSPKAQERGVAGLLLSVYRRSVLQGEELKTPAARIA